MCDVINIKEIKRTKLFTDVQQAFLPFVQNLSMYSGVQITTFDYYHTTRRTEKAIPFYLLHEVLYLQDIPKDNKLHWTAVSLKDSRGIDLCSVSVDASVKTKNIVFSLYFHETGLLTLRWSHMCHNAISQDISESGIQATSYLNNCLIDDILRKIKPISNRSH